VYVIGATVGHTCHILIHDFTHLLGHKDPLINKLFAVFCNMSGAVPSAISFGIYHADHHLFFSEGVNDPDLPITWEVKLFRGKLKKFIYFMLMTPVYAIRPLFAVPKERTKAEWINVIVIMCYNLLVLKFWGFKSLMFLFLSSYFSIGGHPSAVHVMA
jgi:sphingolipid delta-4 desaturase